MNAQHSSASNEHFTPRPIVDAAREVMGGIDLDPASCALANKVVRATRILTIDDDALGHPWTLAESDTAGRPSRAFLNPPGGKVGNKSRAALFWQKLADEWHAGHVEQAVFVAFSLEFLQTGQRSTLSPLSLPFCVPSSRLKFWAPNADGTDVVEGGQPTHANAIVYLPPRVGSRAAAHRFRAAFSRFGDVVIPTVIGPMAEIERAA